MISYNGERIIATRNVMTLPYDKLLRDEHVLIRRFLKCEYHVPLLELPISGYFMKNVTLTLREKDDLHNNLRLLSTNVLDDDFVGDKKEALNNEAVKEALYNEAIKEIKRRLYITKPSRR
ncbi:hypothetical protein Tco_0314357 [Tanacetum coccineum]